MTETTCSGAVPHHPDFTTIGHCGKVMSSLEMKLRSVPEMGYLAEEGKGEILMRGPAVFHGYYRDPWQSRAAFTEDGWVMSGDIGQFKDGNLYVIDRKKNIFKLSQGEYVAFVSLHFACFVIIFIIILFISLPPPPIYI